MSTTDLKTIMHRRIDQLTDEETVLDLFETINSFLEGRTIPFDSNSPEIMAQLKQSLSNVTTNPSGISTEELATKMHQWRTR
ncbi:MULTISPECIES: hypothetical protein [unclassified Spirosoma]|uniref:hypothetical protein n=1 Tax=unclassified Spirosoma TaxID=2621999 RepID=UPI00095F7098|nr:MULTISPECIES: hypothetical protein [unclassified Spirosoma]MBN8823722.1 hypothetical protein [Spirosoma sp.]OJW76731.1 MAG: hypothetical protein BGO59_21060 [Spirosoma sp. 48-14]